MEATTLFPYLTPLSPEQLSCIRAMTDDDLVRFATTPDLAVVVEANIRLKASNEWLSKVLIFLTVSPDRTDITSGMY